MPIEVEQKFCVDDRDALRHRLADLGAVEQQTIEQVDSYFAHPARDFSQTDEALRIRRVGEHNFVTYKGPKLDPTTKTRREIEVPLVDGIATFEQYAALLEALGFRRVADVAKLRQIFELNRAGQTVEIAFDQVQQVGTFLELEIVVPDDAEIGAAQATLQQLASELQLKISERRSYLELLLEQG